MLAHCLKIVIGYILEYFLHVFTPFFILTQLSSTPSKGLGMLGSKEDYLSISLTILFKSGIHLPTFLQYSSYPVPKTFLR